MKLQFMLSKLMASLTSTPIIPILLSSPSSIAHMSSVAGDEGRCGKGGGDCGEDKELIHSAAV